MKLILTNGYPYPYPKGLTQAQEDEHAGRSNEESICLEGVHSVQVLHTITVRFKDSLHAQMAQSKTGWQVWDGHIYTLEAKVSPDDGYDLFPAWVANGMAYCGYLLVED